MSYHKAMRRLAHGEGDGMHDDDTDAYGMDAYDGGMYEHEEEEPGDEGELRRRITDAMPDGDPEAYMASGQGLLDELLANPDRDKLSLILDKEIEELQAMLGDTGDIDLGGLKDAAMSAFDAAAEAGGSSRGAVMAALAAIKSAAGRALGALGITG